MGLSESLALEVARAGVLVNAIAPGPIETPLVEGITEDWKVAKQAELPLGRFGVPAEVAPTAVLLLATLAATSTWASARAQQRRRDALCAARAGRHPAGTGRPPSSPPCRRGHRRLARSPPSPPGSVAASPLARPPPATPSRPPRGNAPSLRTSARYGPGSGGSRLRWHPAVPPPQFGSAGPATVPRAGLGAADGEGRWIRAAHTRLHRLPVVLSWLTGVDGRGPRRLRLRLGLTREIDAAIDMLDGAVVRCAAVLAAPGVGDGLIEQLDDPGGSFGESLEIVLRSAPSFASR